MVDFKIIYIVMKPLEQSMGVVVTKLEQGFRTVLPEFVFVNVSGAQESIPMDRFQVGGPVRQIGLSYRHAMLGIDAWAP
jgi:hypothetical protein